MSFDTYHTTSPDEPPGDESRTTRELLRIAGRPCSACGGRCSAFEMVWSIAVGLKDAPRCLACLARGLDRDSDELREQLTDHVNRRPCFLRAWREAERLEADGPPLAQIATSSAPEAAPADPGDEWDAGDMACGELVLALRLRLTRMAPGAEIRVRATDPAAGEDIPAWCRLTGHTLVSADHPIYLIRRKGA